MQNKSVKQDNSPSKSNPFKEYFQIEDNEMKNDELKSSTMTTLYSTDKYTEKILGKESIETALETKLNKNLNGKQNFRRRSSRFLSIKDKEALKESLEKIGVIKKEEKEEYLNIRKMKEITNEQYNQALNTIANDEALGKLYNHLNTVNCNYKNINSKSIGGLSPLSYLIEIFYLKNKEKITEMYQKYNLLKPYIYNYRTIYGDGNCYYRAVIFRYLEILILNNNIDYLQRFVLDVIESFNSEELNQRRIILNNDVKPDLTFKILFLIVELLKKNMVREAHQVLVKSLSTCMKFDYALILYFRYILYKYIKENENKIYLKSFPIKIGNLLPSQFETEKGEFLFNDFYEKYLLKFFCDAEKIIIYLTPFVLGIEIDVVVIDLSEEDIFQKFLWEGESEIKTNEVICLINKKNHYEVVYSEKDHEKYKSFYEIYENNIPPAFLIENNKENYEIDDNNKSINFMNFNFLNASKTESETKIMIKNSIKNNMVNNNKSNINKNLNNNNNNFNNMNSINNNNINQNNNMNQMNNNNINQMNNNNMNNNNINMNNNIHMNNNYNAQINNNNQMMNNNNNNNIYGINNKNNNIPINNCNDYSSNNINNINQMNNNYIQNNNMHNVNNFNNNNNYNNINNNNYNQNNKANSDYNNMNNTYNQNNIINHNYNNNYNLNNTNNNYNNINNDFNKNNNNYNNKNINNNYNQNNNINHNYNYTNTNNDNNLNNNNNFNNMNNNNMPNKYINNNNINAKNYGNENINNDKNNNIDNTKKKQIVNEYITPNPINIDNNAENNFNNNNNNYSKNNNNELKKNNHNDKNNNLNTDNVKNLQNINQNDNKSNHHNNKDKNNHKSKDNTNNVNIDIKKHNNMNPKTNHPKVKIKENNLNEKLINNIINNNNKINSNNSNSNNNKDNNNINSKTTVKRKKKIIYNEEENVENPKTIFIKKQNEKIKNVDNNINIMDIKNKNQTNIKLKIQIKENQNKENAENAINNKFNPQREINKSPKKNKNNNINKNNNQIKNIENDGNINLNKKNDNNNSNHKNNQGSNNINKKNDNINSNHKNIQDIPQNSNKIKNKINCQKCQKEIQLINSKHPFCEDCFKEHIFNNYMLLLQKNIHPLKYYFDEKKDDLIEIYNINFKNKIDREKFRKRRDEKKCIFYEDCSKESNFKLPCGCYLCVHMKNFLQKYNFECRFVCQCFYIYKRSEMVKLGVFFFKTSNISQKIIDYFNNRTKKNCCICGNEITNQKNVNKAKFHSSDFKKLNLDENNLNNFLEKINHFFCSDKCSKEVFREFTCQICTIKHLSFK